MSAQESKNNIRKPKLKLPFENKKSDMGEWVFDHSAGLCVTVIAYLLFAIVFVGAKIFIGSESQAQGFYIDLEDLAQLEELKEQLEAQVAEKEDFDWGSVSNDVSNENSRYESAVESRNNSTELNREAARAQEAMAANRKAYEDAINQIQEEREQGKRSNDEQQSSQRQDIKRQGNVTVSYSFANPVRHAQDLVVPAYQCQGGGEVVIEAQLDQKGKVVKAEVLRGGDKCMQQTAVKAAKASTFNQSGDAPLSHVGTITYIFIPQ